MAKVGELFDGVLYVGENQRVNQLPKSVMEDNAWIIEMDRRMNIIGGKMQDKYLDIKA